MRHLKSGRKLNRTSSHRKALFRNMTASLLQYELIKTTLPKAKELRGYIEPLITLAKKEAILKNGRLISELNIEEKSRIVSLRRLAFSRLRNKQAVKKLFEVMGERYIKRNGGYTRVLKCGFRSGDAAPMAFIELVDREEKN